MRITEKIYHYVTDNDRVPGEDDSSYIIRKYYQMKNDPDVYFDVPNIWAASILTPSYDPDNLCENNNISIPVQSLSQAAKNIILSAVDRYPYFGNDRIQLKQAIAYEKGLSAAAAAAYEAEQIRIAQLAAEEKRKALEAQAAAEREALNRAIEAEQRAKAEAERLAVEKAAADRGLVTQEEKGTINVADVLTQSAAEIKKDTQTLTELKQTIAAQTGLKVNEIPVTMHVTGEVTTSDQVMSLLQQGSISNTAEVKSRETIVSEEQNKLSPDYIPIIIGGALWIMKKIF